MTGKGRVRKERSAESMAIDRFRDVRVGTGRNVDGPSSWRGVGRRQVLELLGNRLASSEQKTDVYSNGPTAVAEASPPGRAAM